jgi:hypothetical protein
MPVRSLQRSTCPTFAAACSTSPVVPTSVMMSPS